MPEPARKFALIALMLGLSGCAQPHGGLFRNDLNDDIAARVMRGQSGQEVTALLGTPYRQMRFEKLQTTAWDYRYRDSWGYWVDFSVMVGDDGRVTGVFTQRIDMPDRR
jgi:outer membrane protein assembly factor BamE (lipoprotein component of BamABCDE complex)